MADDCEWWDIGCNAGNWVESVVGDAIENMANAVMEAYGKAIASLGTVWVNIGTPNLTGGGGSSPISAGDAPAYSGNVTTVLSYVQWIGLAIAGLSIIILGMLIASKLRQGEGIAAVGRIGVILGGVILIGGAGGLVAGLMPSGPSGASGTVLFLQSAVWWLVGGLVVLSVIIGGVKMAWEQRAEPGRQAIKSLLTLIVVSAIGVTVTGLLVTVADSFSVWVINGSLECDVAGDGACFGSNMLTLIALTSNPATTGGLGALLIIILGLIAILAAAFQIVLMVARGGMLVILAGILPLSASFTNTEMGASWFKKNIGWLLAFILYKPAAAIVYAAAFHLLGTDVFSDDGTGLISILTGLMLMIIALFALPALMRFVTPLVGSMAGGSGGALGIAALAALPTGAAALGRLVTGSGSGSDGASGSTGSTSSPGSSGSPSGSASGSSGSPAPASSGGGASSSGAAASTGSGAAASAGGPIDMAAGAAVGIAADGAKKGAQAVQSVGEQSTEGGPSGGR